MTLPSVPEAHRNREFCTPCHRQLPQGAIMESVASKASISNWNKLQLDSLLPTFQFSTGYPCPHKSLVGLRGRSIDCVLELCSSASSSSTDLQVLDKSELFDALDQDCHSFDSTSSPASPDDWRTSFPDLSEAELRFQPHTTSMSYASHLFANNSSSPCSQQPSEPSISPLTAAVLAGWESKADLMRYDVGLCPTRVLPGSMGFIAQLNEGRANKKRATEVKVDKVCQPWDNNKFNFTKALVGEALVRFEESCSCGKPEHTQQHHAGSCLRSLWAPHTALGCSSSSDTEDFEDNKITGNKAKAGRSFCCDCAIPTAESEPLSPTSTSSSVSSNLSLILVNVSPIDYGHVLLVPSILQCQPQLLTTDFVLYGLHFARQLNHPHMRVGYNSLGAFATINHLHFQAYFLAHTLPCERAPTQPLRLTSGMDVAAGSGLTITSLAQYPVRGFVIELGPNPDNTTVLAAAHFLGRACTRMQAADLPFNLLITNCGERVFIWPQRYAARQAAHQVPEAMLDTGVNPAAFEIAGHLVLKRSEDYEMADEAWAWKLLEGVSLSDSEFSAASTLCWS